MPHIHHHDRASRSAITGRRGAFTLVELVVVIVILSILASLTLSGLNGARQRAKIDKTRSTIRKLHEIVIPLYEGYTEKRFTPSAMMVGFGGKKASLNATDTRALTSSVAGYQVFAKRVMLGIDLPDLWDDAWSQAGPYDPDGVPGNYSSAFGYLFTAPNPRYQAMGDRCFGTGIVTPDRAMAYESAECLQMIVVRGGYAADAVEQFRADEIGDVDGDGAPEFLDGWGRPISFIRWPVGFVSVLQSTSANDPPDPLDPLGVTQQVNGFTDRAVIPLIYSGGPNNSLDIDTSATAGTYGLVSSREALGGGWQESGWINVASLNRSGGAAPQYSTVRWPIAGPWAGAVKAGSSNGMTNARAASDNITNHDLVTK